MVVTDRQTDRHCFYYNIDVAYGNMARTSEQQYRILEANAARSLTTSYDLFQKIVFVNRQGSMLNTK